ncbi:unnamed protein product [Pleuronectes platessa]|uniref:Uncharacterized protein n=1 Tax=Pleuronectes platessa TaxID=8262 RepID=A0A9N7V1A5_PLEPL|nr:unnamed protein product [Pleuronectes platessa]
MNGRFTRRLLTEIARERTQQQPAKLIERPPRCERHIRATGFPRDDAINSPHLQMQIIFAARERPAALIAAIRTCELYAILKRPPLGVRRAVLARADALCDGSSTTDSAGPMTEAYTNDWLGLVDGKDTLIEGGEENAEWKEERVGECAVRTLQPV